VKYTDDLALLIKEEMVLKGMTDRLTENWMMLWNRNECGKN
jgi:hypothetical protein